MKNIFFKILTPLGIGLLLSFIGTIILIIPNTFSTRNINDDFIISMDRETGNYTQVKHVREKVINKIWLSLLASGFLLQLIDIVKRK